MFLRHRVGVDDPRLLTVYAHFQQNLKDICAAAARHDAGVVLCTVGVNLRDCPPFASLHGTGVTSAIALAWSNDIAAAEAAEHAGDNSKAAGHYRMALQRDPLHAETHYRAARLLGAVGDAVATGDHFALARDDDALRFRADSVINRIIRMTAAAQTGRVALADIEHVFAAASASGSPGNDLFFEHVHLTFDGTWLAASTMAARVVALLAAPTSAGRLPTAQECREQLGYTAWDEYRITREIARDFLQSPPFTAQLEHTVRVAAAQTRLAALQTGFTARVVAQIEAAYRRVLTRRPDDWQVRSNLAGFLLTARRKPAEAVVELQRVLAATPHNAGVLQTLARTYLQMRQSADAIAACRRSLRIMPWNATTYNDLGIALLQTNDAKAAARAFRSALRCDPSNAQAHCNLGIVALSQGDSVAAVRHFSDGLTITPDDPDLHKNLATAYARHNAWADAERHYRIAVRDGAASADVFAGLGICLIRLGRPYEAIDVLRYALALQPDLAQARAALAAAQAELSAAPRQLPK
jgi:tetratricopeptide (TPR) repeat protein